MDSEPSCARPGAYAWQTGAPIPPYAWAKGLKLSSAPCQAALDGAKLAPYHWQTGAPVEPYAWLPAGQRPDSTHHASN